MRRIGTVLILASVGLITLTQGSYAVNRVTVVSDTFDINSGPDTVGILITNDINISGLVIPLEIRTVTGGAFTKPAATPPPFTNTTFKWEEVPGSRLAVSPLGATADPDGNWPAGNLTRIRYARPHPADSALCSGPNASTFSTAGPGGQTDGVSPDALLYAVVSTGNPEFEQVFLIPGADVTPSIRIVFPVNGNPGTFEIDTCCVRPANHVSFVNDSTQAVGVEFVKGTITLVASAVKELETGVIPYEYVLEQNYPNPFNAGTVIRFQTPTDGNVKIDVYNILGRKVRTLVDEFRVAGLHQTDWNGRSDDGQEVSTGVYFYRITAERFNSTRKMIMLK